MVSGLPQPGQRQLPILCRNCMGPAEVGDHGAVSCPFCGARDRLPADQLSRALELERRLGAARASVVNVAGMEGALSEIFERRGAFWSAAGIYVVLAAIIPLYSLFTAWPAIHKAPADLHLGLIMNALMGGVWIGGIALSLLVSFAVGRALYRRRVRVHLFARIPRQPGLPARCRACDGGLPDRRDAFVLCEYCGTRNLVTPELQANREVLLERERDFYAQRAGAALGATSKVSIAMKRVLMVCFALTYIALIGFAYLAGASFPGR